MVTSGERRRDSDHLLGAALPCGLVALSGHVAMANAVASIFSHSQAVRLVSRSTSKGRAEQTQIQARHGSQPKISKTTPCKVAGGRRQGRFGQILDTSGKSGALLHHHTIRKRSFARNGAP